MRAEAVLERQKRGLAGLGDASRPPKTHPNQSPPEVDAAVLRVVDRLQGLVPRRRRAAAAASASCPC
jgi:hypothetical protein